MQIWPFSEFSKPFCATSFGISSVSSLTTSPDMWYRELNITNTNQQIIQKTILLISSVPSFSWHCANFCLLLIFTRLDTIRIPKKIRLTFSVKSKDQLDYPILWSTKGWWSSQWGLHSKTESASDLRAFSSPPLRGCGFPDRLVGHAKISLIYVFVWLKDSNKGPF